MEQKLTWFLIGFFVGALVVLVMEFFILGPDLLRLAQ
ncbi:hypothetical protein LCGC14_1021050 [marine sediment metagenome]|uniref:Uncharacterized protein n=1 Tax=marine sediment metagenome TaxID=412755 RepID=A0A0F9QFI3_9ZZZZ